MDDELLRALARLEKRHSPPDASMESRANSVADAPGIPADLITPFDASERAAILDAVFARVDGDAGGTDVVPLAPVKSATATRRGVAGMVAIVVAIAAALILWIARPGPESELPSYDLTELRGGSSAIRSEPGALDRVLELRRGESVEVVVTPQVPSRVPVVVDLVATSEDKPATMARVPAEISASGAVRIVGRLDEWLALSAGEWRLHVSIAPIERAPTSAQQALADEGVRRVQFRVRIAAEP